MKEKLFLPPIEPEGMGRQTSDSKKYPPNVMGSRSERCDKNYKDMYESCREELMATKRKLSEEKVQSRNYLIEAKEHRLETLKLTLTGSKQEQMIKKLREQVEELRNEKKAWLKMKKIYFEEELWKEKTDEEKGDGERRRGLREKKTVGKNSRAGEKQVDSVRKSGEKIGGERGLGQKEEIVGMKNRAAKKNGTAVKNGEDGKIIRMKKSGVKDINDVKAKGETLRRKKMGAKVDEQRDQAHHGGKETHNNRSVNLSPLDHQSPSPDLQSEADHGRYEIPSVFTPLPLMEKLISWKPPLPPSAQLPAEYRMDRRKEAILRKVV